MVASSPFLQSDTQQQEPSPTAGTPTEQSNNEEAAPSRSAAPEQKKPNYRIRYTLHVSDQSCTIKDKECVTCPVNK